ncbi:hypothetical protein DSL72_001700 [Monilinia vaccinii-corymbosi]|uniref:Uncharacterized protein n=1 Tax=Monilinia vaccinii-corymbosi TaxID=61207 RepID=A0A8A3P826_9HELO|nr:hypothetical protein DSL72_001700 [Monilinia vaccinii-corymbosi]
MWLTSLGVFTECFPQMLTIIVDLDHQKLFERALPAYFSNTKTVSLMSTMTRRHGPDWLPTTIAKYIRRLKHFDSQCLAIKYVYLSSQAHQELKLSSEWKSTQYELAVSPLELTSTRCCEQLLRVADTLSDQEIVKILLPVIDRCKKSIMVFELLAIIAKRLQSSITSRQLEYLTMIFQHKLSDRTFAGSFDLDRFFDTSPPPNLLYPNFSWLAEILFAAHHLAMAPEMELILRSIRRVAHTASENRFTTRLLPFCYSLIATLKNHSPATLHLPVLQHFFQRVLSWYIIRCKPVKPVSSKDWTQNARGSGCLDCNRLDAFLTHCKKSNLAFIVKSEDINGNFSRACHHYEVQMRVDIVQNLIRTSQNANTAEFRVDKIRTSREVMLSNYNENTKTVQDQISRLDKSSLKILLAGHYDYITRLEHVSSISAAPITSAAMELPDSRSRDVMTRPPAAGNLGVSSQSASLQIEMASPGVHGTISNNSSVGGKGSRKRKLSIDEAKFVFSAVRS